MSHALLTSAASAGRRAVVFLADPPNPGKGSPPPGSAQLTSILGWVAWVVLALCVCGVLVVAGRMAISHQRGQGGEHATGLAYVLGACVLVGIASTVVGMLS